MDAMLGPDGRPSRFDGAAWVSADGRFWWNGAAWQPIKRPGLRLPIALPALILVVAFGAWFVVTKVLPPPGSSVVVIGVSGAKIDSSSQIELDYARADMCPDLTFEIVFYDQSGHALPGTYITDHHYNVTGGVSHHYVFYSVNSIPSGAARFDASAVCHR